MALSDLQQRFVDEYLIDLNATQAAIRAGYSERTAASQGERLLRKVEIQATIAAGRAVQQERTKIDADRVLLEYVRLGLSDVGQILDFSGTEPRLRPANEIPEMARRAISSVKVRRYWEGSGETAREVEVTEFKLWDKAAALAKLAAHVGICQDTLRHKIGGDPDNQTPIQTKVTLTDEQRDERLRILAERIRLRRSVITHANGTGGVGSVFGGNGSAADADGMGGNPPSPSNDE